MTKNDKDIFVLVKRIHSFRNLQKFTTQFILFSKCVLKLNGESYNFSRVSREVD